MDKEVLEVVLKNRARESSIKRIIDIKSESAVPKGENYTSAIIKLTLKVVLGNGRIATKSFIMKKENTGAAADQLSKDYSLFKMEASVYNNILKQMDYLMEEFEDPEGPLWCEFIHYDQADSIIILEDLKTSGFRTVKRAETQDFDHAKLALRSLGRYHAMAKVLEDRGFISKDGYKPYSFLYNDVYIQTISYGGYRALVKAMKASWGKEWADTAEKLGRMTFEEYSKRMKNCGTFDDDTFKCLNHGDTWNNNMMFKYNWEGRPIEMRLVDFQIPHYNSPCIDVTYFMYTSIKPEIRRQQYKTLIALYHQSLTSSLDKYGYKGPKPSLEDFEKNMDRMSFFGLSFFTGCFPVVVTTRNDATDIDKLFTSNGEEGINLSVYCEDGLIEKIAEDIKALLKLQES